MSYTVEKDFYVHDIRNPPTNDRKSNIHLKLVNSYKYFSFIKIEESFHTKYLLTIINPLKLGFTNQEQSILNKEFASLISSMNLSLNRACVTRSSANFSQDKVHFSPSESTSKTSKKDNKTSIDITEKPIKIRDSNSIKVTSSEELIEQKTVEVFQNLQKKLSAFTSSSIFDVNFNNALSCYNEAMITFDPIQKFKNMFQTLETIVNLDGKKREGTAFDNHANKLSPILITTISNWREFYNRIKHPQRHTKDIATRDSGINNLPDTLIEIRKYVNNLIISSL